MCGIIGILGQTPVAERLLAGLKRLEYRGYDSSGIATVTPGGSLGRRRAEGKLQALVDRVAAEPLPGETGIGHTRWATHGAPLERNAHPHATAKVAIVHNGIIENYRALKEELARDGYPLESDTDTEVVAQLFTRALDCGESPRQAAMAIFPRLTGAFSLALIFTETPDLMIGARMGTPMAVGHGEGEVFLASDAVALAPMTNRVTYLEDGDFVILERGRAAEIFRFDGQRVEREQKLSRVSAAAVERGNYRHFMLKEIHEQPEVLADTLQAQIHPSLGRVVFGQLPFQPDALDRLTITACGTAYYAGMTAKLWMERLARLPVEAAIASELRYSDAPLPVRGAGLAISQSGETLDTLEALRWMKGQGYPTLAVVNVPESTIAREAAAVLYTQAGTEIGVASTKAFTTQLTTVLALALDFAHRRERLDEAALMARTDQLRTLPALAAAALKLEPQIEALAERLAEARDALYLGRGLMYPVALEGALKLKEISYIHAEGYPAGELKHGPIALIDRSMPVVLLAPPGDVTLDKTLSNLAEVAARGAETILISDARGCAEAADVATHSLCLPEMPLWLTPVIYTIPLQLLAYHTAVRKGTDVDQPRNLAKSVTVE